MGVNFSPHSKRRSPKGPLANADYSSLHSSDKNRAPGLPHPLLRQEQGTGSHPLTSGSQPLLPPMTELLCLTPSFAALG